MPNKLTREFIDKTRNNPLMKTLAIIILTLFSAAIYGQEIKHEFDGHKWEAPYTLPIPKDWAIERFPIPITFAPQISYKGVEDIRFTPGWGKVKSDEYWSYAFLWYLEGEIKIDPQIIDSNLKAYYTGLISINGRNIPNTSSDIIQRSQKRQR